MEESTIANIKDVLEEIENAIGGLLGEEDPDEWDRIEKDIYEDRNRPSDRERINFDEE